MPIQRGDYVRPNHLSLGLPRGSVWRVICADGPLKLEPENSVARSVSRWVTFGCRFPALDFKRVELCSGQWVEVADFPREHCGVDTSYSPNFKNLTKPQISAVATAETNLTNAANATAAMEDLLEDARKLEAERQEELRIAKAAKAKADKEAAARAKREEAREALAAKLHADRCLAGATLELIAEVSRLNNGGSEQVADPSIASHAEQLQPLAKSYGYRIVKPSMLAQVVKL